LKPKNMIRNGSPGTMLQSIVNPTGLSDNMLFWRVSRLNPR
jgi:hypothetical protein